MTRRMTVILLSLVAGVGSFTFSAGLRVKEAHAAFCNCSYYCPVTGRNELGREQSGNCDQHWNCFMCDLPK